jgi:hypothetical protein
LFGTIAVVTFLPPLSPFVLAETGGNQSGPGQRLGFLAQSLKGGLQAHQFGSHYSPLGPLGFPFFSL